MSLAHGSCLRVRLLSLSASYSSALGHRAASAVSLPFQGHSSAIPQHHACSGTSSASIPALNKRVGHSVKAVLFFFPTNSSPGFSHCCTTDSTADGLLQDRTQQMSLSSCRTPAPVSMASAVTSNQITGVHPFFFFFDKFVIHLPPVSHFSSLKYLLTKQETRLMLSSESHTCNEEHRSLMRV